MNNPTATKTAIKLPKSQYPRCLRCQKAVDKVKLTPNPTDSDQLIIEYECHGEHVSQEMPASVLETGLAAYTAFNAYTSGLMLASTPKKTNAKRRAPSGNKQESAKPNHSADQSSTKNSNRRTRRKKNAREMTPGMQRTGENPVKREKNPNTE